MNVEDPAREEFIVRAKRELAAHACLRPALRADEEARLGPLLERVRQRVRKETVLLGRIGSIRDALVDLEVSMHLLLEVCGPSRKKGCPQGPTQNSERAVGIAASGIRIALWAEGRLARKKSVKTNQPPNQP